MDRKFKITINYLLILIISVAVGFLLLVLSYFLPVDQMSYNVLITSKNYVSEGEYPNIIVDDDATRIDNYTSELMLLEAIYDGEENVVDKAINVYRREIPNSNNKFADTLFKLDKILKGKVYTEKTAYPRYWHGYLIVLKPLLLFFNHTQIKILNLIIQTMLLAYIVFLMTKNNLTKYIYPFVLSVLLTYPFVIALNMQYSTIYYILLLSLIVLLNKKEVVKKYYGMYFFIIGIITCYFDFFTFPLVTLGIPLIFSVISYEGTFLEKMKKIAQSSIAWLLGYCLMWLSKFAIGSLLTGKNIFMDGFSQVMYRSGINNSSYEQMIDSIEYNFKYMFWTRTNIFIIVFSILYFVFIAIKRKAKFNVHFALQNSVLLIISLFPIFWFAVVTNHTSEHYFMVYRLIMIMTFAIMSYVVSSFTNTD